MFLFLALILLFALPGPWNLVGASVCFVLFLGELAFWNRRVRGREPAMGVHTLVGKTATVTRACRPRGQVRVGGELWEARCDDGADTGSPVRVVAIEGLTLVVEQAPR